MKGFSFRGGSTIFALLLLIESAAAVATEPMAYWPMAEFQDGYYWDMMDNAPHLNSKWQPKYIASGLNFGPAVNFEQGNYFYTTNKTLPVFLGAFSLEIWVNISVHGGRQVLLQHGLWDAGSSVFSLHLAGQSKTFDVGRQEAGHLAFVVNDGAQVAAVSDAEILEVGEWYHIAVTYTGSVLNLYKNGVLVQSQPYIGAPTPGSEPLFVGGLPDGDSIKDGVNGYMAEVFLFDSAITEAEISEHYALSGAERPPEPVVFSENGYISASDMQYEGAEIVVDGAVVTIDGMHNFKRLEIVNGGHVTHSNQAGLSLSIEGLFRLSSDSKISVSGRGFSATSTSNYGASHGGAGAGSTADSTYGNFEEPTTFGRSPSSTRGGGAIKLQADQAVIDGAILADGLQPSSYGGTSGGSIWLIVNTLSGAGSLSAQG
ncbi:LamG domain-containing protein, partial [Microbulbifer aestuariivivens]|uniref:LamG domain-containing protein n=1 Tax=Microbulbifer aestuariivivens TaxID=1908308 RepID=UPI0031F04FD7